MLSITWSSSSFYHHIKWMCFCWSFFPSTPSRSVVLGKGLIFFYFIFFSSGCRLLILILFPSTPSRSLVLGGWGWLTQSGMARPAQGSPLVKYPRWGRGPVARSKYWILRLVNNLRRGVSIQLLYFTCVWYGLKSLCLVWCLVLSRPPQIVVVICPFNLWLYNSTSLT